MAAGLPAEAMSASALVSDEGVDAVVEGVLAGTVKRWDEGRGEARVKTGVRSVDDALEGGLQSGDVVGVSGESSEVSVWDIKKRIIYWITIL